MCTIILCRNVFDDWPLVLAANRDEFYERPTAPPAWQSTQVSIFAGRDLEAGGTWLGVRTDGRFAALTNQPSATNGRQA